MAIVVFGQYQMDFNGSSSYISFNDNVLYGKTEFTVELWVKPTNVGSGYKSLVGEDNCVEFGFKNGNIHAWLEGRTGSGNHIWKSVYAGSGLSSLNGTWHHIALVAGSYIKVYLDGVEIYSSSNQIKTFRSSGTAKNLSIGAYTYSSSGNWFAGSMDEIRIWNKALSADDIRTMMCQNISVSGSSIKGEFTNEASPSSLSWTNDLECLYHMDYTTSSNLWDAHYPFLDGTRHNISRTSETSPLPYISVGNGNWSSSSTWKTAQGKPQNKWAITQVNHNVNVDEAATSRWVNVKSGKTLEINSNKSLEVSDLIDNSGSVEVNAHAALIQTNTGSDNNKGSGNYTIHREGGNSDTKYNIWSSPIQAASLMNTYSGVNPCDVYVFEGSGQNWKYDYASGFTASCKGNPVTFSNGDVISSGDGLMDPGRGYYVPGKAGTAMRTFQGDVNNGSINFPVYAANNPGGVDWAGDNWNLLGNPYPSSLDLRVSSPNSFMNVNSSNITGDIYFWIDDNSGGTGYNASQDYAVYNGTGGTSANGSEVPSGFAASGQGFWVIATQNGNVEFNNSMRSSSNNNIFYKSANDASNAKVWLNLTNDRNQFNQILIGMIANSTRDYDMGFDAIKAEGNDKINFASVIGEETYSIQAIPQMNAHDSAGVELYMDLGYEGVHFISIDETLNMGDNDEIYLLDKLKNKVHDLKTGPYSFYNAQQGEQKERFYLQLIKGEDSVQTSVENKEDISDQVSVLTGEGYFIFDATSTLIEIESVDVLDMHGRLVTNLSSSGMKTKWETNGVVPGIYHVLIHSKNEVITKRVFVK